MDEVSLHSTQRDNDDHEDIEGQPERPGPEPIRAPPGTPAPRPATSGGRSCPHSGTTAAYGAEFVANSGPARCRADTAALHRR